jgi:hypothetical protein
MRMWHLLRTEQYRKTTDFRGDDGKVGDYLCERRMRGCRIGDKQGRLPGLRRRLARYALMSERVFQK